MNSMPAKKRVAERLKAKTSKNPAQKKTTTPAARKKPAPNATGQYPAASPAAAPGKKPAPNATGQYPAASPAAAAARAVRAARALPLKSASPSPTLRVKRPLPAKSVQKAADAFKKFSLSRFAQNATPANYVPTAQAKTPSAVAAVQRKSVTTQIAALAANPPRTLGMSVALTPTSVAQLLPSLNAKTGTVGLAELLAALQQNLRGKQFYATGNPTLNLVVQNFTLLSQVKAYLSALKAGTGGSSTAVGTPGTAPHVFKPSQEQRPRPWLKRTRVSRSSHAAAAKRRAVAIKKGGA
jgi:hypothetical protein